MPNQMKLRATFTRQGYTYKVSHFYSLSIEMTKCMDNNFQKGFRAECWHGSDGIEANFSFSASKRTSEKNIRNKMRCRKLP